MVLLKVAMHIPATDFERWRCGDTDETIMRCIWSISSVTVEEQIICIPNMVHVRGSVISSPEIVMIVECGLYFF